MPPWMPLTTGLIERAKARLAAAGPIWPYEVIVVPPVLVLTGTPTGILHILAGR